MGDTADPVMRTATSTTPEVGAPSQPNPRAEKIAAFRAAQKTANAPAPVDAPPVAPKLADPAPSAPAIEANPGEPDPQASKGLDAIEKRDKRLREQFAADKKAAREELDRERAELAKMRADITGKTVPLDELKKLPAQRRAIEALKLAGIDPDDEEAMDVIARDIYARSKSGKADPKNRAYANEVGEKQALQSEIAELRKMIEETRGEVSERDKRTQVERFQSEYLDSAIKAIPSDASFIALHHKTNPAKARAALLEVGQRLESENGETPTHAEVIERYEAETKRDLKERGLSDAQIASMLAPPALANPAVAAQAHAPTRTLNPSVGSTTQTSQTLSTREQRVAAAKQGRLKSNVTA